MWCPEGYLTWEEFRTACFQAGRNHFRASRPEAAQPFSKATVQAADFGFVVSHWLLHEALENDELSICSTGGVCLKVTTSALLAFTHESDEIDVMAYDPFVENEPAPEEWINSYASPKLLFVDWQTGILIRPGADILEREIRRTSGINDPDLRRWTTEEWEMALIISSKFDGWALCIKEERGLNFFDKVLAKYDDDEGGDRNIPPSERGGRPRERDRLAAVYLEMFPNGHHPYSWNQVSKLIEAKTGFPCHPVTIKRGLRGIEQNPVQNPEQ